MKHKTRIDLDKKVRGTVVELLERRLADSQDLYFQVKQAHWGVRGPRFIALHEMFDKLADDIEDYTDDLAERIAQLGSAVEGTVAVVAKRSTLPVYPLKAVSGDEHIEAVAVAIADFGAKVRADIDLASKAGDANTADLFTEISRGTDKWLWFVEAHQQSDR